MNKIIIQSFIDLITNSSTEIYQLATDYTVESVKEIINTILKIAESDKKCDDLFDIFIDYSDMLEEYFEDIDRHGSEEFKQQIDKICEENKNLTITELYNKCLSVIEVNGWETIESFINNYDKYFRYPQSEIKIIPKKDFSKKDLNVLDKINNLFDLEACYDG